MLKKNVTVKDQFGTEYSIQATVDKNSCSTMLHSNLRYITIDGEDIRPGFEMFFQSLNSGKIFGGVSKSMLKKSRLDFDKIEKCE